MSRAEFKTSVRLAAWERCKGRCENCTAKLFPGKYQFDHVRPDGLGGEATLENCQVLCSACHHTKTVEEDRPVMQKADNVKRKHVLPHEPSRSFRKPEGYKYNWGRRE